MNWEKILRFLIPDLDRKMDEAIYHVNFGGGLQDVDKVADAYFHLAKKMYRKNLHFFKKPERVELTDNSMVVQIDGEEYDFGFISHNDLRGTSWKMDIEVLYNPEFQELLQEKLTQRVRDEW